MKRKIGELRNIPIVEGDKNLVREGTEIHINDLQSKGSSGGEGLSTDSFLYMKSTSDIYANDGMHMFYPFYRGLNKQQLPTGMGIYLDPIYFTPKDGSGYGMYVAEIFKVKDLEIVFDGVPVQLDTTSYNSLIESMVNGYLSLEQEYSKEEMITMLESQMVEITKEEFEELWNTYNV